MKRSGTADLPLHNGRVPPWLAERMTALGSAIVEHIVLTYGPSEFLTRLSDPFWFQALGCVMGMDWHSSGITTSVMGALKRGLNPRVADLGFTICGGRGRHSKRTPEELRAVSSRNGLDGDTLARTSRLTARVDNNAIADGFQLYLHSFVIHDSGEWAVIQQGMNPASHLARRYHWHSAAVRDFTSEPHSAIVGEHQGLIMNLVDQQAQPAQNAMLSLVLERPETIMHEARKLLLPRRHEVHETDVDLPCRQQLELLFRAALLQIQLHAGKFRAEGAKNRRQRGMWKRPGKADAQRACNAFRHAPRCNAHAVRLRQRLARFGQDRAARVRQPHLVLGAVEKPSAKLVFQLPDLLAQRRLRHVQPRGRAREVQFLRDGHEIPQMSEFDAHMQDVYPYIILILDAYGAFPLPLCL